ncbi:MAG TPA: DinB family protein [Bryobacteraceae bacterium]|nr:DinB family protein [Bryobacteraceae bacterium]
MTPKTKIDAVLLTQWTEVGNKLVRLAEEFPEDRYEFRPNGDVRSFAEVLRHVAFWNQYVAATAQGEEVDGSRNELPAAEFGTKKRIVAALRKSFTEAGAALQGQKDGELAVPFLVHSAEHCGQMIVYYRLNGLTPPEN